MFAKNSKLGVNGMMNSKIMVYTVLIAMLFMGTAFASSGSYVDRGVSSTTLLQGASVVVTLNVHLVSPDSYYAIDEVYPAGWTVTDPGTGDTSELGHLKWVVITGAANTAYSYTLSAPSSALGSSPFSGIYGFSSGSQPITGVQSVTVLAPQTITFGPLSAVTYGDAPFAVSATASSGLPVSFTASGAACTVSGSTVNIMSAGSCTITASQAGNGNYNAATPVSQTLTVNTKALTITADAQSKVYGTADPALTYTITSGALVGSDTLTGALVRDSGENVGSYAINQGTLAASSNYVLTYAPANLAISAASQTITFGALTAVTYGDAPFAVSATASSGLPVSFTASGDCTVTGTTVSITSAGSCTITASQAGNGNYNAATDVPQTLTITPGAIPLIAINLPVSGSIYNTSNVPLNFTVSSDAAKCWYDFGGAATYPLPGCANTELILYNGDYVVNVYAADAAGNPDVDSTQFTVANPSVPTISLVSPVNGSSTEATSATFIWKATGYDTSGLLNCIINIDGAPVTNNIAVTSGVQASFGSGAIAYGTHNWTVSCTDGAGNTNISGKRVFTLTAPAAATTTTTGGSTGGSGGGSSGGSGGVESSTTSTEVPVDVGGTTCIVTISRTMQSTNTSSVLTTTLTNMGGTNCTMANYVFTDTVPSSFASMNEISFSPQYSSASGPSVTYVFPTFAGGESKTLTYTVARWASPRRADDFVTYKMTASKPAAPVTPPAATVPTPVVPVANPATPAPELPVIATAPASAAATPLAAGALVDTNGVFSMLGLAVMAIVGLAVIGMSAFLLWNKKCTNCSAKNGAFAKTCSKCHTSFKPAKAS